MDINKQLKEIFLMTVVKIDSYLQSGCNDNSFSMKIIDNNDNSSHKMVGNVFVTRQRWFMIMKCQIRLSTFKIFVFIIVRNHSYRNEQKGPYSKSQSDHRGCGSIWLFELFFFFSLPDDKSRNDGYDYSSFKWQFFVAVVVSTFNQ